MVTANVIAIWPAKLTVVSLPIRRSPITGWKRYVLKDIRPAQVLKNASQCLAATNSSTERATSTVEAPNAAAANGNKAFARPRSRLRRLRGRGARRRLQQRARAQEAAPAPFHRDAAAAHRCVALRRTHRDSRARGRARGRSLAVPGTARNDADVHELVGARRPGFDKHTYALLARELAKTPRERILYLVTRVDGDQRITADGERSRARASAIR